MEASKPLIRFIKHYESLHDGDLKKIGLQPKVCPAGFWTEGWGRVLIGPDGKMLKYGGKYTTIESVLPFSRIKTEAQADADLVEDLKRYANGVRKNLTVQVSQNQFDALLSHRYNCGHSATLYKLVNSCAPEKDIKRWFTTKYITAGGVYMKGLQYRRNDEWEIWAGINYDREYKLSV